MYEILDGQLYKRSFGGPLLKCVGPREAEEIIEETHKGICAAHQGGYTMARKILIQGYFWPTMVRDCVLKASRCEVCQFFAPNKTRPATYYTPVSTVIPFARWGIDIVGPLRKEVPKYCVVAIDYFTKWVEAEPLTTITEYQVRRFFWRNVICRFGLPQQVVTDHGTQFESSQFKELCSMYRIKHTFSSVAYPQSNGQVKNSNRTILDGLKKNMRDAGRIWVEELPRILWAYRTTPRRATGESPFALAYGFEARAPSEALNPTVRMIQYNEELNDENQRVEKNFLEERRDQAQRKMAEYQRSVKRYCDSRARPRYFRVGDLVVRERKASKPNEGGKMAPKWEGPYRIAAIVRPGTYKLETTEGRIIDRTWNSHHLNKFYQ